MMGWDVSKTKREGRGAMPTFGFGAVSCNLEANICDLEKTSSAGNGIDGEWFATLLHINELKKIQRY
jgi:hypothetical protein